MVVHTKKNYVKKLREKTSSIILVTSIDEKNTPPIVRETHHCGASQACHPFNADKEQEATYATVPTGNKPETRAPNSGSRAEGVCS